jgi:hypothetical protein
MQPRIIAHLGYSGQTALAFFGPDANPPWTCLRPLDGIILRGKGQSLALNTEGTPLPEGGEEPGQCPLTGFRFFVVDKRIDPHVLRHVLGMRVPARSVDGNDLAPRM